MVSSFTIIPGIRHFNTQSTTYSTDFLIRDKWMTDTVNKKFRSLEEACEFIAKNRARFKFMFESTKYTSTAFGVCILRNGKKWAFVYKPSTRLIVEEFGNTSSWETTYYYLRTDGWMDEIED